LETNRVTLLWLSSIVGAAVVVTIALAALDYQRRLFFASNGPAAHGAPKRAGVSARRIRLRPALPGIRKTVDRVTAVAAGVRDFSARRRPRQEHAARIILRAMSETPASEPPRDGLPNEPPETTALRADSGAELHPIGGSLMYTAAAAEGIVRVDRSGQVKFADPIARELLHWTSGALTLGAILGGEREAAAMMEAVARQEVVEQILTVRTDASSARLHATALASRGSDGSLWGALLILRRL
jgi:PAS domain-containing protein